MFAERFEAMTGWDIIEHSREPIGLLGAMRRCLAPGGVVGLSTPNQRSILDVVAGLLYRASAGRITAPLEKFYIEQHFLYLTPATLTQALARAGLGVVELRRESHRSHAPHPLLARALRPRALFSVARWTALENRLFAIARPTDSSGPFARSGRGPDHTSPPR